MSQLWPRIDPARAYSLLRDFRGYSITGLADLASADMSGATFAATGGDRVTEPMVKDLTTALRQTAIRHGYPVPANNAGRNAFDRDAAQDLFQCMLVTSVEAANHGVWNYLALVAAPDLVLWRWTGSENKERWICSDRTRHMFARLWWQALTFAAPAADGRVDHGLLRALSESELNQITERRSLAGNPRLAQALARMLVAAPAETRRRELLRNVTPRLRRRLAFIDFAALDEEQIDDHVRSLIRSSQM